MHARVRLLRHHGALLGTPERPDEWRVGRLETETHQRGAKPVRRLVLRQFDSGQGLGVLAAMYQPQVVEVTGTGMRLRGLEEVTSEDGKVAGVVQEWAVRFPEPEPLPQGQAFYLAARGALPVA